MKLSRTLSLYRAKRYLVDGLILRGYRRRTPDSIIIETTNRCTLRCSCCPNGVARDRLRPAGTMSRETFEAVLGHLPETVKKVYLHLCGEPFLVADLPYFARRIAESGRTPIVFSNGWKIDLERLDSLLDVPRVRLSFSMDLIGKAHYEDIRRPALYEEALESLRRIDEVFARKKKVYTLNVIVDRTVADEVAKTCDGLFARFSRLNSLALTSRWPWPGLKDTGDLAGHLSRKGKLCTQMRRMPAVLWTGEVAFCDLDWSGETIIGRLDKESFARVWNGRAARRLRRALYMDRRDRHPLCSRCVLPRYDSYTTLLSRAMWKKMDSAERARFTAGLHRYFDIL